MTSGLRDIAGAAHGRLVMGRRVRVLAAHVAQVLPERARVLDVGCGDGQIARLVMELRPDVSIEGIDVLVREHTAIPVAQFDGERIPHDDGAIDVAMAVDVLHHTPSPPRLLAEMARVARRAVVLKDHLREGFAAGLTLRAMDWVGNAPHGVVLPYNYLSRAEWEQAFVSAELRPEVWLDDLGLYPPPVSWVCERKLHFVTRLGRAVR